MTVLAVDPEALYAAGSAVVAAGEGLGAAMTVLTAGFGANTGSDIAGEVFALGYQSAAESLLKLATAAVNACQQNGALIQQGASTYSIAEAASKLGGGASVLHPPAAPAKVAAPGPPGTLGPGEPPPLLWAVVQPLVDSVWPDGDVASLRVAAGCWRTFDSAAGGMRDALNASKTLIGTQQLPEGGRIIDVLSRMGDAIGTLGAQSGKVATLLDNFADQVAQVQHDIRDLLHRLDSLTDIWNDVVLILDGDALEEIKKIAQDINAVLHHLGREARAFEQGIKLLMHTADGLVVDMEEFMRGQFKNFLGDVVGNQVATVFDTVVNANEGFVEEGVQAVLGLVDLGPGWIFLDPKGAEATWKATLESQFKASLVNEILHPREGGQANLQMWKSLLHLDDWSTARPGKGFGKDAFDGLTFLLPGVGEAGAGAEAGSAAARGAEGAGELAEGAGTAGRAGEFAGVAGTLGDIDKVGANLTKDLNNLKLDVPKTDLPVGGRPLSAPPVEAPCAPAPRPVESAPPGTPPPHSPTVPSGPAPDRTGTPVGPHESGPVPAGGPREPTLPLEGRPRDPGPAPPDGAHEPVRTSPGSPHESVPAPASVTPTDQLPSRYPQLAEPATPSAPALGDGLPVDHVPGGGGLHGPGDGSTPGDHLTEPSARASGTPQGPRELGSPDTGRPIDASSPDAHDQQVEPEDLSVAEPGSAGEQRHAISGHGGYDPKHGDTTVPRGTSATVYAEHGSSISDALGNLIETGGDTSSVYSKTFHAGELMPDYTIYPPHGLNIMGAPQTVLHPTRLSELLKEDMGPVDLAVCTFDPTCPTGKIYDVDGILDESTKTFETYER